MNLTDTHADDLTVDHWWWRPGWRIGRSFYTWHVTFAGSRTIEGLVPRFAPTLATLPTLDPVTESGLHITVQGIGFADKVSDHDVERIIDAARRRCAGLEPQQLHLGPVAVDQEALGLPVTNPDGLRQVRVRLQEAIGTIWGEDEVPEAGQPFRPHLTLAYSTGATSIGGLHSTLAAAGPDNITVTEHVSAISLIELNRDKKQYEWRDITTVVLGKS